MSRVSEGKKGRVICAWCKGDMGEAETVLDTHGCCLKCVKSALREVDERLSAHEHAQAVKEFARARGRSRKRRVWRVGEKPVNLSVLYGPLGMVGTRFRCPGCGQHVEVEDEGEDLFYHCECGARMRLRIEPGLEEVELATWKTPPGASP